MPDRPMMTPPVGKSGPLIYSISPARSMSGSSIIAHMPRTTSRRLWGGMLVAMPTAMPWLPFTSRLGKRLGSTWGSLVVSSKLGSQSMVSFSMSVSISQAILDMRASVYR